MGGTHDDTMTAFGAAQVQRQVRLCIRRFDPERDTEPHWATYESLSPRPIVYSMIYHVKCYVDGSLTFRRSCWHGVCGSDAMRVNGVNRSVCKLLTKDPGDEVLVEPFKGLPMHEDLLVDMEPFFESVRHVDPWLIRGAGADARTVAVPRAAAAFRRHDEVPPVRRLNQRMPRVLGRRPVRRAGCPWSMRIASSSTAGTPAGRSSRSVARRSAGGPDRPGALFTGGQSHVSGGCGRPTWTRSPSMRTGKVRTAFVAGGPRARPVSRSNREPCR